MGKSMTAVGLCLAVLAVGSGALRADDPFRRGDGNADGVVDVSDAARIVRHASGEDEASCPDALDADDNGIVELSDAVFLFQYLFEEDVALPNPGASTAGIDPTPDDLAGCAYDVTPATPFAQTRLEFLYCPDSLTGRPGSTTSFTADVALTTTGNPLPDGPEAWSFSVSCEGAELGRPVVWDEEVSTVYYHDDDEDPLTPPVVIFPHVIQLRDALELETGTATFPDAPEKSGAVSSILLGGEEKLVLLPEGTQTIARIRVSMVARAESGPITLRLEDGGVGRQGQPVPNAVTIAGVTHAPELDTCFIPVVVLPGATFEYVFDGHPETLSGSPGEVKRFDVYPSVSTTGNTGTNGAQGWSWSLGIEGGTLEEVTLDEVWVSTVYYGDDDDNPDTPPILRDPWEIDLGEDPSYKWAEIGFHTEDESRPGAVSAIVLSYTEKMELQPEGTQRVARMRVSTTVGPDDGEVRLFYEDGFRSPRSMWVSNNVTIAGTTRLPVLGSLEIPVNSHEPYAIKLGDMNADGRQDISDAIYALNYLFLGGEEPPCRRALDMTGDLVVDISDPVFLLRFIFLHEGSPREPYRNCGIDEVAESLSCESYPPCNP